MMAEQGYITQAQAETDEGRADGHGAERWACPRRRAISSTPCAQQAERAGISVMNGGYRIYTTLDPALQRAGRHGDHRRHESHRAAEGLQAPHAGRGEEQRERTICRRWPSRSIRSPATCARSSAVATTRAHRSIARSSAKRQPGSSIKPIVYAKAIEDSIPANTIVPDTALTIELPGGDEPYKPTEIDGKFWGSVTMREGKPAAR